MSLPPQFRSSTPAPVTMQQAVRTSQIICGAMMMGIITFAGIVVTRPAPPNPALPMAYIAIGFAAIAIIVRFIVPAFVAKNESSKLKGASPESLDAGLYGVFQTKMIIGLALLEGAGFMNLIAYMTGGQWWSLATVGLLLLLMAMMFPTLTKFESWAEDVKRGWQNEF
jgi:hypothetical protein